MPVWRRQLILVTAHDGYEPKHPVVDCVGAIGTDHEVTSRFREADLNRIAGRVRRGRADEKCTAVRVHQDMVWIVQSIQGRIRPAVYHHLAIVIRDKVLEIGCTGCWVADGRPSLTKIFRNVLARGVIGDLVVRIIFGPPFERRLRAGILVHIKLCGQIGGCAESRTRRATPSSAPRYAPTADTDSPFSVSRLLSSAARTPSPRQFSTYRARSANPARHCDAKG